MAAKFEKTFDINNQEDMEKRISGIVPTLSKKYRWHVVAKTAEKTVMKSEVNGRSWGEIIAIQRDQNSIRVHSECPFPLQFIDYGKNRQNVDRICEALLIPSTSSNQQKLSDKENNASRIVAGPFLTWIDPVTPEETGFNSCGDFSVTRNVAMVPQ